MIFQYIQKSEDKIFIYKQNGRYFLSKTQRYYFIHDIGYLLAINMLRNKLSMLKCLIFLLRINFSTLAPFTLSQTITDFHRVEGIGFSHYLAVADYNGDLTIFSNKADQFTPHQTIPAGNGIWEVTMTDDNWLGVGYSSCPAVYVLNSSTQQFELMQEFPQQTDVLSIQMSADHQFFVIGNSNGQVIVYRLIHGKYEESQLIQHPEGQVTSVSLTPNGKELVIGMTYYAVYVYVKFGSQFILRTTINSEYSFRRVKMSGNHQCLAIASRDFSAVQIYRKQRTNLVYSQSITDIPNSSIDLTTDCQQMVIGSRGSGFYYKSDGHIFTQVQQLPTDDQVLMSSKIYSTHQLIFLGSSSGTLYVYSKNSQLTAQ